MENKSMIQVERYEEILDELEKNGMYFEKLNAMEKEEISNDPIAMEIATESNFYALNFASNKLRSDSNFMFDCFCINMQSISFASSKLLARETFINKVIKKTKENTRNMINKSYEFGVGEEKYIDECVTYGKSIIEHINNIHKLAKEKEMKKQSALDIMK